MLFYHMLQNKWLVYEMVLYYLVILNTLLFPVLEKKMAKLIKSWGHHKSWPKHSHSYTLIDYWGEHVQEARALHWEYRASNLYLRIDRILASCNWHGMEWGDEVPSEIIRSQHIQNVINNKPNVKLDEEMELMFTWKHRCFVFGMLCLTHEAGRHIRYNLMNLLGRSQIDNFRSIQSRKCQRQTNYCNALLRKTIQPQILLTVEQTNSLMNHNANRPIKALYLDSIEAT